MIQILQVVDKNTKMGIILIICNYNTLSKYKFSV